MPFWRGEHLAKAGSTIFYPFEPSQIDCNAYTLRMGDRYFVTSDGEADSKSKKVLLPAGASLVIPPGQFAYLLTHEKVQIPPDAMAFLSMRTPAKFKGLINVSGFNVDPGYQGKILYAVFNAGPTDIAITEGEKLFKIWLCDLKALPADVKPSTQFIKKPGDGITDIGNDLIHGMSPPIVSLQDLKASLNELEEKFNTQKPVVDNLVTIYRGIIMAVLIAILWAIVQLGIPFFQKNPAPHDTSPGQSHQTGTQDQSQP